MDLRREGQILESWGGVITQMAMGGDGCWAQAVHLKGLEIPLSGAFEGQEPGEVATGQGRALAVGRPLTGPSLFIGKEVAACRMGGE